MRLETARLVLREVTEEDAAPIQAYRSDPAYPRFYDASHQTPDGVRQFISMLLDWQREQPRTKFQLAILVKETGSLVGNCGLRERSAGAAEADIGIELAPAAWARGYAREAMDAILRFGFEERKLHRLWAELVGGNDAAVRLVDKRPRQNRRSVVPPRRGAAGRRC